MHGEFMKVKTLAAFCKIAARISNPSSLTSLYRSIEIGPEALKCCSEFGNLHILLLDNDIGLKNVCLLDTEDLLNILQSLPSDGDITLDEQVNKINWSCDNAKGTLNHVQSDHQTPPIKHANFPWSPPADFSNALLLASCACQAAAVSIGLYGVTIEPDGNDLNFISSNSISVAATKIVKDTYPGGKKVTLRPPVPAIIANLIASCPNCFLDVTDDGVFIIGDWIMAHLPLGTDLDHDLLKLAKQYTTANETVKINSSAVKKFITRARNLTEKQSNFTVSLKIEQGKLIMMHEGISSSSEQWFLAEGIDPSIVYTPISLPADLLLLPLEFVQHLVLDYIKSEQSLVLRGTSPEFTYVLGGN